MTNPRICPQKFSVGSPATRSTNDGGLPMPGRRPSRFGELLRALRQREGLSQRELAELANVSERAISDLERGVARNPQKETALRLARAFGLHGRERDNFERANRRHQDTASMPRTGRSTTRTLPRDITSFTGRTAELDQLAGAAGSGGIYAIHGMAGAGKTALAIRAAHDLAPWFPDGQLFLELHAHTRGQQAASPPGALADLLTMIGVPVGQIPEGFDDRTRLWRDRLADRHLILVLDDASSSDQVKSLLPSSAGSLALITCRQMLSGLDDIRSISLDMLQRAEAIELLLTLSGRQDVERDDPALGWLAELCGYLPLAIGMAASRLRDHQSWTPADLAADLNAARDRQELLDAENLAIAAAFELSYQELPTDQRRLFRFLGRHPGVDIDVSSAAALSDSDLRSARLGLDGLYRKHLIDEPVRGRYRLHDLIREYASMLADTGSPDEQDAATDRLLDFYLYSARRADRHLARRVALGVPIEISVPPAAAPELRTQDEALAWMRIELPNLTAAIYYAAAHHRFAQVVAITAAMNGFMRSRVHWDQALALHKLAVSAAGQLGDQVALASALNDLGDLERAAGDYEAAATTLARGITHCQRIADVAGEAAATYGLAAIAYLTADYPAAKASLRKALKLYRHQNDRLGEARTLDVLGALQEATGDYAAAAASLTRALKLFQDIDHGIGEASCLNHLGVLQLSMGDHSAAVVSQEKAIKLNRLAGDRLGEANALNNLAAAQLALADLVAASTSVERALELYGELGIEHGTANALNHRGVIQAAARQLDAAQDSQLRAYDLYQKHGDSIGQATALSDLGSAQQAAMRYADAMSSFARALDLFRSFGDPAEEAETLCKTGELLLAMADPGRAHDDFGKALAIAVEIGSLPVTARAFEGIGRCHIQLDQRPEAIAALTRAADTYEQISPASAQRVRDILRSQH